MADTRPDIAFLVYDLRGSGVVRNVLRIAEAAAAAGLSVQLWAVRAEGSLLGRLPRGISLKVIGSPLARLGRTAGSAGAIRAIERHLCRERPRLFFSGGNQIHLFAALAWQLAGDDVRHEMRFIGRASNAVIDLAHRRHERGGWWRSLAGQVERFQYRSMNHIVAVAHELRSDLAHSLNLPDAKLGVISNGVNLAEISAAAKADAPVPDGPFVIAVGRLSHQKNFALLVDAFAILRRTREAKLVILGDGPPGQWRLLENRLQRHNLLLGEDVIMPGFVDNPFAWMERACVFVLSSRWEGLSNALIEALACGCPIVATDIPTGVREVLAQGQYGTLVQADDPEAMAQAIAEEMAHCLDPAYRARQRARVADFALSDTLAAYVALFREHMPQPRD